MTSIATVETSSTQPVMVEVVEQTSPINASAIISINAIPTETIVQASLSSIELEVSPVYTTPDVKLKNPVFTYTNGMLARIDYDDDVSKIFNYSNTQLVTLDINSGLLTTRKEFNYDINGNLLSIDESSVT